MKYDNRIEFKNNKKLNKKGEYALYWMQNAMRVDYNHVLDFCVRKANEMDVPVLVVFIINKTYMDATENHYKFMLQGLSEVKDELLKKNIKISFLIGETVDKVMEVCEKASFVATEKGYLKNEKNWRQTLSSKINIPMIEVDTNVIVPVKEVSDKEEYAAYTIRPKINKMLEQYALDFKVDSPNNSSLNIELIDEVDFDINNILSMLSLETNEYELYYKGGVSEARAHLKAFLENKLDNYAKLRNEPSLDFQSNMSMYLQFGQISPLEIYLKTKHKNNNDQFIEELVIRRELSYNFVYYNTDYDSYKCLPNWVIKSLDKHREDKREYIYNLSQLENSDTHDNYWNACQKEMVLTGKMHGYMRMYWGKKVIEWTKDYKKAYEILIYLNNKYNIDGRGPNAYAGVAWCFGKHDRPWFERNIFGKIRYMNDQGLKRKFDMDAYLKKIKRIEEFYGKVD